MCLRDQGLHKSYTNLSARSMTQGNIFLASYSQIRISEGPRHRHLAKGYSFLLREGNVDSYLIPWSWSNIPTGRWSDFHSRWYL